ncbi:MAG: queuosine precursor transporter [Flavobacteriales bacterium]
MILQPKSLTPSQRDLAMRIFLLLSALFIASLVACNLIFRKFFHLEGFGGALVFEQSVGLLPYPVTFLVTDLISELYGKRKANTVVLAGLVASGFTLIIIWVSQGVHAAEWSPVNDLEFDHVFGSTVVAVAASMSAYLLAQFLDVRLFHFWKNWTNGKKLWLRNNLSTIPSQFVDTFSVLFLMCAVGEIEWVLFGGLLLNGFIFKVLIAVVDTPLVYLGSWLVRRQFGLRLGEEIAL